MKKFLAFTICFICLIAVQAQISFQQDTTSFSSQMNTVFTHLDKTKVPFGILQDYAMEFTNIQAYDGIKLADSTKTTYATVLDVYNTLVSGIVYTSAGSFVHPLYLDSLWQSKRQAGVITLGGLFYQYAAFRDDAVTNNLITITNNQLYDKYVNGVWQNPYQSLKTFAISASTNAYNSNGSYSVKAILPSSLWLTNSASLISSIQVDFSDGTGYKTLTKDQLLSVSYTTGGTKTWSFKLTLTGGIVLLSKTDLVFDSTSGSAFNNKHIVNEPGGACAINKFDRLFNMRTDFSAPPPSPAQFVTADVAYYGQKASGWYTINYANSDHILRRPLIVAEGFDPDDVLVPEEQFGSNNITSFIAAVTKSNSQLYNLLLNDPLTLQYDIVYVDWQHSGDFVERNALLLEKIIDIVNQQSGNAPAVLLGQSMGGLVSRWALKDMENKGINHHVRMFLSFDSPQQGANVPLAYQYLSRQARDIYYKQNINSLLNEYNNIIIPVANNLTRVVNLVKQLFNGAPGNFLSTINTDIVRGALNLQDQPSAREMLINYVNSKFQVDNTIHNSWQASLSALGYPQGFTGQPCVNIAVSNGSECAATQDFSPGQALFNISGNVNTRYLGDVLAPNLIALLPAVSSFPNYVPGDILLTHPSLLLGVLPGKNTFSAQFTLNAQPDGIAASQYYGKLSYQKKIVWLIPINVTISSLSVTSSPSILPFDYFPGGEEFTNLNLSNSDYQNALIKYSLTVSAEQSSFCFIPVPSALDLGKGTVTLTKSDYLTPYVGALPPTGAKSSPFTNGFTTAFDVISGSRNNNEQHIQITQRNGDWVYHQIVGTPQQSNCSFFCGYNTIGITGNSLLCSSGTYNLTGTLPPVANRIINWSASPSGIINFTTGITGTSVGISKNATGATVLTAQIRVNDAYGNVCGIINPFENIQSGAPSVSVSATSFGCNGSSQTWKLSANPTSNGSNWNWYVDYGSANIYSPTYPSTNVDVASSAVVNLNYTDLCGLTQTAGGPTLPNQYCHGLVAYKIIPNPAQNNIVVSADNKTDLKSNSLNLIYAVKLTNQHGTILKSFNYKSGIKSTNISLNGINSGAYLVSIFDGTKWNSKQLIIQK